MPAGRAFVSSDGGPRGGFAVGALNYVYERASCRAASIAARSSSINDARLAEGGSPAFDASLAISETSQTDCPDQPRNL
jgi:hypothetical protein